MDWLARGWRPCCESWVASLEVQTARRRSSSSRPCWRTRGRRLLVSRSGSATVVQKSLCFEMFMCFVYGNASHANLVVGAWKA